MIDARLFKEINRLLEDLGARRIDAIISDGRAGRFSRADLKRVLDELEGNINSLSMEEAGRIDIIPAAAEDNSLSIVVDLIVDGEASDYSLEMTAEREFDSYKIEMDDLHIL